MVLETSAINRRPTQPVTLAKIKNVFSGHGVYITFFYFPKCFPWLTSSISPSTKLIYSQLTFIHIPILVKAWKSNYTLPSGLDEKDTENGDQQQYWWHWSQNLPHFPLLLFMVIVLWCVRCFTGKTKDRILEGRKSGVFPHTLKKQRHDHHYKSNMCK